MNDSIFSNGRMASLALLLFIAGTSACLNTAVPTQNAEASLNTINSEPLPSRTPTGGESEFRDHFKTALTLANSNKEAAIAEMEKALEIHPDDKIALNWIADWYSALKRPEDEANIYRRWIKIDPNDMRAHGQLASLLIRQLKQYDEGLREAQSAQSICTGRMCYVYDKRIAEAYEGLNDYPNAVDHYKLYLKGSKADGDPNPNSEIRKKIVELQAKGNH